jgi:Septum formation
MLVRRVLLVGIGLVASALTLAGCTFLAPPSPSAIPTATTPAVGACWNATVAQADEWADWRGTAATSCARSHSLYTYQVGAITGESGSSWASASDPSALRATVQTKAASACHLSTLLPDEKWNQQLIEAFFFVPTEAQWRAGARWVRCDVGVLKTGTTIADESFRALPASIMTFVRAVRSDPERFEFCINSNESVSEAGPLDNPDATIADCTKDPQWKLAAHANLPGAAGAAFPDDATANAESTKICAPAASGDGQVWLAYLPTKAGWAAGDRTVDCWVGQKTVVGGQTA